MDITKEKWLLFFSSSLLFLFKFIIFIFNIFLLIVLIGLVFPEIGAYITQLIWGVIVGFSFYFYFNFGLNLGFILEFGILNLVIILSVIFVIPFLLYIFSIFRLCKKNKKNNDCYILKYFFNSLYSFALILIINIIFCFYSILNLVNNYSFINFIINLIAFGIWFIANWIFFRLNSLFISNHLEELYRLTKHDLFLLSSKLIHSYFYFGIYFLIFILVPFSFLKMKTNLDLDDN